jgi:SET domain-containing protein
LEFFNHSQNAQCCVNQRNDSEQVSTIRPIKKGEEIFVKYGDNISLEEFLEDYGMIPYDEGSNPPLK